MRIALIPSSFAPRLGGVEELTLRLAQALVAQGDEVEVWSPIPSADGQWGSDEVDGIAVRRIPMSLVAAKPTALVRFISSGTSSLRALRRAHRGFRPEVLHVQCFSANGAFATMLGRLTRTPLVLSLQGETFMDDHDIYGRSAQMRAALRAGLRRASWVTACSQYTLDDAVRRFHDPGPRSSVVFNGVDLTEGGSGAAHSQERYLLGIGRVVRNKGFDRLLDAYAEIADRHPDVSLTVAGDGAELPHLKAQAEALGIADRVTFFGRADRAAVSMLMRGAEAVVVPSRVEPFGIVVLEAWRAGAPVVATTSGGIPEFVEHGVSGLLVDPADTQEFAATLDELLTSATLRASLAHQGTEAVTRFTWPVIASQYRSIYRTAVGS